MRTLDPPHPDLADDQPSGGPLRWDVDSYLAAWEAGVLPDRIELLDGDLHVMSPIGRWHGTTTMLLGQLLAGPQVVITSESLVLPNLESMPDPDLWVRRRGAEPIRHLAGRLDRFSVWSIDDVLLVVEVGDSTERADLEVKAALYANAGVERYWAVSRSGIVVHTRPDPTQAEWRSVQRFGIGEQVPYLDRTLQVDEIVTGA